jgi:hypothetical protein
VKRSWPLLLLACACVGLPHADGGDAARAQSLYPGVDVATLELGRQTYVARCSGCHALHLPSRLSPEEWARRVHEMGKDARLQPGEEQLITQYLVAISMRHAKQTASASLANRTAP